jgi:hypothetical protein
MRMFILCSKYSPRTEEEDDENRKRRRLEEKFVEHEEECDGGKAVSGSDDKVWFAGKTHCHLCKWTDRVDCL